MEKHAVSPSSRYFLATVVCNFLKRLMESSLREKAVCLCVDGSYECRLILRLSVFVYFLKNALCVDGHDYYECMPYHKNDEERFVCR